jgi:uroporphyrinogen-III decarboxylase
MATKIQNLSDLSDRLGFTVLAAPDRFPMIGSFGSDQKKNLVVAFERLEEGFPLVEKKIKDPAVLKQLRNLLSDALAAYQQSDRKKGAHLLQDFENIVFPNRFKEYEERKGESGA